MRSNDHLIEAIANLGVFLNPKDIKSIQRAVKRDLRVDKKLKKRERKLRMISEHSVK